ncbi:hypothetical protein [Streptomyces sp. NRRL B-1347]|uniref:hypothetical protein n=1 Tax=Streptomyces sp. NRRL B-1347 TaxID=1476877 RepID=UPI000A4863AC|nr:hypothetical protein [Streptomyces sp. NRRL B-1347]
METAPEREPSARPARHPTRLAARLPQGVAPILLDEPPQSAEPQPERLARALAACFEGGTEQTATWDVTSPPCCPPSPTRQANTCWGRGSTCSSSPPATASSLATPQPT